MHKIIHCLNCNRQETAWMSNSTNHPSTYSYKAGEKSASKFTRPHWECWGGMGVGSKHTPTAILPAFTGARHRTLGRSLTLKMLQEQESVSHDKVWLCGHAVLAVVLIFSIWKISRNANNTATAVFSSSRLSWCHNHQIQAPQRSKWYYSQRHTPQGHTPSHQKKDSRAVLCFVGVISPLFRVAI